MEKITDTGRKLTALFAGPNRVKLVVALGIAGMALILISHYTGAGAKAGGTEQKPTTAAADVNEEYIIKMEQKLTELVVGIEGVGEARVMLTLQSGEENVYALEERRNTDKSEESGSDGGSGKVWQKENIEQSYILVDTEQGRKQALVKTRLQPKIQGVVIACEGADDVLVRASLTNVVTTALDVSSTRVCVVKIKSNIIQEETQ